ncbi:RING/FYVE/PHD ZINC FINGER SUPERFAMILY PROTEIN [Salix purpurea]|uniref:RING/FYVE/PHD ZINC FINGER SUPERFAMILY PROTEIN n=1 Tax=Salix purpurea TaxID=77065 RepID=A0A9Q0ZRE2_SALPP|nr:RING/FYVE/PHD ZINC FINGER SUPERFAMILY PROTEIN [Salix purpurea]
MRRKVHTSTESGTCNVCFAPCSSCMHLKLACMGSKGDAFSDETCHVTASSQFSYNDGDGLVSFKSRACDSLQHTTSEASNLLSVSSSHDSLSENAESKVNRKSSDADASAESHMHPKMTSGRAVADDQFSSKAESFPDQKTFSKTHVDSKSEEGHDDNISCFSSRAEGSGKALLSHKSGSFETPSNDVDAGSSSPKVQTKCLSSNANAATIDCVGNLAAHNIADNQANGKSTLDADSSKVSCKINSKLELDADKDSGDQADEGFKCSDQIERKEKLNEPDGLADIPMLQSASGDESDESEILEHDVKVCDICGDAGREDSLAICSRCADGAEHIYCMREMLQNLPEGDWLCEECKLIEEAENQKQDAEEKRMNVASTQNSGKRHAEPVELASAPKKQATETSLASPKSCSPSRIAAVSRDTSSKSLDKGKVKIGHQTSFGNKSCIDIPEFARPSVNGPRVQTLKGALLKSNSSNTLNSKLKAKLVDEVPQKRKGTRESSFDMEEPGRMMRKSMSFKSVSSGRSSTNELKVKMLSSKFSQIQDSRGLKQVKDRDAVDRKKLSRLDRPLGSSMTSSAVVSAPKVDQRLTPRGESVIAPSTGNPRELKSAQSDGKLGALLRSTSNVGCKGADTPVTSVRASSTNGISSNSMEQKLNQISPKDEPSSSSWNAERLSCNATENLQDGLPQSRESSNQENCTVVSPLASGTDVSTSRIPRVEMSKGSKLKAVVAAMIKKPGIYKKKKEIDQSNGLSSSNVDESDSNNVKQPNEHSNDDACPFKVGSDSIALYSGKSVHASAEKSVLTKMSAIPEHEYIWHGIQAHLSTCASPKVLDVVSKFPQKINLDEVPRLSTWPRQFHVTGAKEENIALYFFAKNFESYENYKRLLDNMIKKDLALKGSFEGVEFFIFPSTQLPENSQRWNMLYFLWGVFRGSRSDFSDSFKKLAMPSLNGVPRDKDIPAAVMTSSENLCVPECIVKNTSACDSSSHVFLVANAPEKPSVSLNGNSDDKVFNSQTKLEKQDGKVDSRSLTKIPRSSTPWYPETRCNSRSLFSERLGIVGDFVAEEVGPPRCTLDVDPKPFTEVTQTNSGSDMKGIQVHEGASCPGEDMQSFKIFGVGSQNSGCGRIFGEDKIVDRTFSDRDNIIVERDLNEDIVNMDVETFSEKGPGKRPFLDLSDTAPLILSSMTQKAPWNKEDNNSSSIEERSYDKASVEKVILEELGTSERYFFPVDSHPVKDSRLPCNLHALELVKATRIQISSLPWGAETKPPNILPFFGMAEKNHNQKKPPDKVMNKEEDDDVSASLSLSLSFPFPDKEHTVKPVLKTVPHVPERCDLNTSLLLFRGLPDK